MIVNESQVRGWMKYEKGRENFWVQHLHATKFWDQTVSTSDFFKVACTIIKHHLFDCINDFFPGHLLKAFIASFLL